MRLNSFADGVKKKMQLTLGEGRTKIHLEAVSCGDDLVVVITGGEKPHIGAAVLAVPCNTIGYENTQSASANVLVVQGHREDELARKCALLLSKTLHKTILLSCGIHSDNGSETEILVLIENMERIISAYIAKIL